MDVCKLSKQSRGELLVRGLGDSTADPGLRRLGSLMLAFALTGAFERCGADCLISISHIAARSRPALRRLAHPALNP